MTFKIGQTFENSYPPEAAIWCNENNAFIEREENLFVIKEAMMPGKDEMERLVRMKRDSLLAESDKYVLCDYPITDQRKETFKAYRQILRDIPEQTDFPYKVIFPEKP